MDLFLVPPRALLFPEIAKREGKGGMESVEVRLDVEGCVCVK